ncbi:MAG: DUF1156 domain-containing protein, partial [Acidimicrobiales bacterium]
FGGEVRVGSEEHYREWVLHLCGIWGDPVAGRALLDQANAEGRKIKGNGYGYKQAYKNSPNPDDLDLLHCVLEWAWGSLPSVLDPTAGGGSIPYEAARYGLPAHANDLNQVAAATLRAGVEIAATFGPPLADDLEKWGGVLVDRLAGRLSPYFLREALQEKVVGYLHARTVACPRTGKPVPLSPNWWITKAKGDEHAVRLLTTRDGVALDEPAFDLLHGEEAVASDPDRGTVARGVGVSPWDGLAIDGDYIKSEAQAGRMGSLLYAVAIRTPTVGANGRTKWVRSFRPPTATDHGALAAAEAELAGRLPGWLAAGCVPTEEIPEGNDARPHHYGMRFWRDMFSPRQLLVHGTFVEEHRRLGEEVEAHEPPERAAAIVGLLGLMTSKALNYNSLLASWHTKDAIIRPVFDRHDFAFKWQFAEFEGAEALWEWVHERNVVNFRAIAATLQPGSSSWTVGGQVVHGTGHGLRHPVPGPVVVSRGPGSSLAGVADRSRALVCIDPPYYDNVMYGELSDFFGVWEQHTVGRAWPDLMPGGTADLKNEAVANPARFKEFGRRKSQLATADYEAKMHAIFAECHRVLRDDGVCTVMFTHKRAEAWDTLGMALLEAGFTIESSWPVHTESEQSLHQAEKNAAESTVMLVCRKRETQDGGAPYFEDLEGEVRQAAKEAVARFAAAGIGGVDLLLSTYGPALSVVSAHWPVFSAEADETGRSRLLRPEEALAAAREEVVRMQRLALIGHHVELDPLTDFVLLAWSTFGAASFPFDEARRLALAVGGLDVSRLEDDKIVTTRAGTVTLCAPKERLRRRGDERPGVRPGADAFSGPVIDAVHTVLYVAEEDGLAAAKSLMDRAGLTGDGRVLACLQGLVHAIPRTKIKGAWVRPEAGLLDALATAFLPDIDLPEARTGQLDLGG